MNWITRMFSSRSRSALVKEIRRTRGFLRLVSPAFDQSFQLPDGFSLELAKSAQKKRGYFLFNTYGGGNAQSTLPISTQFNIRNRSKSNRAPMRSRASEFISQVMRNPWKSLPHPRKLRCSIQTWHPVQLPHSWPDGQLRKRE